MARYLDPSGPIPAPRAGLVEPEPHPDDAAGAALGPFPLAQGMPEATLS